MANEKYAMHADFTIEQHDEIQKNIRVVGKKEAFWYDLCEHDRMPKADKLKYRHQVLIDPTKVHILNEGQTPDPTKVKAVEFYVTVFNIGSWFKYTRESRDLNLDSIVEMASNQLAHERLYDLERIRGDVYRGTTCTVTKTEDTWEKFLLRCKTQLRKNKAKPVSGNDYLFIAPGEILNGIIVELGDKLKAVGAGEDIIVKGAIGRCSGFIFKENDDETMYVHHDAVGTSGQEGYAAAYDEAVALLIGKNEFGEYPVKERSYAGTNDSVANVGCDVKDKNDPLGQFGFVSSRIDGVGAVLTDENCVLKLSSTVSKLTANYPQFKVVEATKNYDKDDIIVENDVSHSITPVRTSSPETEYDD